jgi:hypothetical protein
VIRASPWGNLQIGIDSLLKMEGFMKNQNISENDVPVVQILPAAPKTST